MRSLLFDIFGAFDNVYSGWILWNLFLAFVPLLLSFRLFRPKAIPKTWFRLLCGVVGAVGIIGFVPRADFCWAGGPAPSDRPLRAMVAPSYDWPG